MEDSSTDDDVPTETRENQSRSKNVEVKFGHNLWMEVERWRRKESGVNWENSQCKSKEARKDTSSASSPSKKARYSWQVKKSSRNLSIEGEAGTSGTQTPEAAAKLLQNNHSGQRSTAENEAAECSISTADKSSGNTEKTAETQKVNFSGGACKIPIEGNEKKRSLKRKLSDSPDKDSSPKKKKVTQPPYLDRWQKKHIAKAVVDNAVNRTISELGLSPDTDINNFAAQSRSVEQEGVSTVIQSRGLHSSKVKTADLFEYLAPTVDVFNDHTENLSFDGMFHMIGSLDFNPVGLMPGVETSSPLVCTCHESASNKDETTTEESDQASSSETSDKKDEEPATNADTPSVMNEALSAVIAEKGLVFK